MNQAGYSGRPGHRFTERPAAFAAGPFFFDGCNELVFILNCFTNYLSWDHNGFRSNPGVAQSFEWTSPAFGTVADYTGPLVTRRHARLADYARATGQDRHSVLVDYDVLRKVTPLARRDPTRLYEPADFDASLRPRSAAIDNGEELPTITYGFVSRAPDLGAFVPSASMPHYGPRGAMD